MQAMRMHPNGNQQTYDFATMYTQLKLFADPDTDPNDPGRREVLHSKMKAYTDLVFEYAKQAVAPYRVEKILEVQNWGNSPTP